MWTPLHEGVKQSHGIREPLVTVFVKEPKNDVAKSARNSRVEILRRETFEEKDVMNHVPTRSFVVQKRMLARCVFV